MMLELHNVSIGQLIRSFSLTVADGQAVCLVGAQGSGKTTLLRAIVGLIPVDGGHISVDGELLTPQSAPYFRRQMAYVPQRLLVPEGYSDVSTDYVDLLGRAVSSGKQLLIVDEPAQALDADRWQAADRLLSVALRRGASVLVVNAQNVEKRVSL